MLYTTAYMKLSIAYDTNPEIFYTDPKDKSGLTIEKFSIGSSLNCPKRHPVPENKCYSSSAVDKSIYPQCQKYKGKTNTCMETVCASSCNLDKIASCS